MFKSVLVPVDVTVPSETRRILDAAKELVAPWGAALHVVTVVPDMGTALVGAQFSPKFGEESRAKARQELQGAAEAAGVTGELHVLSGTVYDKVIALADELDVDLILLGAHRPELKEYLLGSNAARMVRHSKRSVLVLREKP